MFELVQHSGLHLFCAALHIRRDERSMLWLWWHRFAYVLGCAFVGKK